MSSARSDLPGPLFIVLLLSLPLLILVPVFLIGAYKRALQRWMGATADPDPADPETPDHETPDHQPPAAPAHAWPQHHKLTPPPSYWISLARSRQRRCVLIYTVAGACAAASLTLALMGESGVRRPLAFLTIFAANLWPVLLSAGAIFRWSSQAWRRWVLCYAVVFGLLAMLQHFRQATANVDHAKAGAANVLLLFLLLNTPATIFFRTMSLRNTRQVGPTLLPFCIAIVMGPQLLLYVGPTHFSLAFWITRLSIHLRLTALGGVAFVMLAAMLFMALAGRAIGLLLVVLYRSRRISEQMLLLDALWFLFFAYPALDLLIFTGHETGSGLGWVLAAFPLYFLVAHGGLLLATPAPKQTALAPGLLVLRAFALQRRAEAVFQPVTTLWRYLGPVRLIGAPDLAASTIDPGIFFEFTSGRLRDLFIRSVKDFRARQSLQTQLPDPDGRFRIQDFFCFKTAWQPAVSSLIRDSSVILADFRGLGHALPGGGCDWEVGEIARSSALPRCVFLLDDATDDLRLHSRLSAFAATSTTPIDLSTLRILHPGQLTDASIEHLLAALLTGVPQREPSLGATQPQGA